MIINFVDYQSQNKEIKTEKVLPSLDKSINFDCLKNRRKEIAVEKAIQRAKKLAW